MSRAALALALILATLDAQAPRARLDAAEIAARAIAARHSPAGSVSEFE